MTKTLKILTAVLLLAAMAAFSAVSCSQNEVLRQRELPEAFLTVSDTVTEEPAATTTAAETTAAATAATTAAATTTTATTTTTASATTTTSAATTTTAPPVTTTTATPPPVTTTATTAAAPVPAESMADQVFRLVNEIRAEYGLPAFKKLDSLTSAAQKRAGEISVSYSHTRPGGKTSSSVLAEYGLNYSLTGENIAAGQMTAQQVVNDWMNSTMGHREAILNPRYQYLGVGFVVLNSGDTQGFRYYWTQEFFTPL